MSESGRAIKRPTSCAGMTLIELIMTIVILAVALTGITAALSSGLGRSADALIETRAVALAQSYLDEILARRFDQQSDVRGIPPCWADCTEAIDFGPTPAEFSCGRTCFDDVDDYHNLDEGWNSVSGEPLRDADGMLRQGYDSFRVRVTVRYLEPATEAGLNIGVQPASDPLWVRNAKLVTVNVSHPSNASGWDFSAYKANF